MQLKIYLYPLFILTLVAIGFTLSYALRKLGKNWTFKSLLKDFNRKMWMTLYLGITFFSLYFILIMLSSLFLRSWGSKLLPLALKNPTPFIYLGLCTFAVLSLSIYFVRMIIKYAYLTRGKDGG